MSFDGQAITFGGRTAWGRNLAAPVRSFLSTETGGAAVMLAAAITALVWANSPWSHSYESVWTTRLVIRVGRAGISADLRHWVNEGLMTLFFLVVGLEAKRELDLGQLRERRRLAIPVVGAIGGITVPVLIYLAFNAGVAGAHGWGAAMSTDTAFGLAAAALLTPRTATRMRVFLLTLAVVDDLAAPAGDRNRVHQPCFGGGAGGIAVALFGLLLALRYAPLGRDAISIVVAVGLWVALFKSGIDVRYVWRHLPLNDVHPRAQLAAEAAEAADAQGKFWDMYDMLLSRQGELGPRDLRGYAEQLGLDVDRFRNELRRREYAPRVSEDVASADESGVSGTPTFFINGRRHYGVYDVDTLSEAVRAAKNRARLAATIPVAAGS